ncbi:S-adenosyl-L-methionine-dependent methyltransferase [Podospora didyma]|uniref:S-adenosyl-L-methionine-dependent methyltransferase n=1 Tax=Podospora didyma TaxID=330526 RepID=A0AAE0U4D4_9PEZI|nr:S-adenosyl-L-methionine-dependent methyltransferase [Podospora didyma]
MDALLKQLSTLAAQADAAGRAKILDSLRTLQLSLETPHDTLQRFSGLHLEIAGARIGEDLNLFQLLSESDEPLTTAALAAKTGAAPLLLSRILRYLASVGQITEAGPDVFSANAVTKTLAQPGYRGGIYHFFDNCGPVFQAFPDFLKETKYADVTDASKTAFQKAFPTDLPAFMWLPSQPERFASLQQVMTVHFAAGVPWFAVFPLEKELGTGFETALVDVGGGFGHQVGALAGVFPALQGKLVLQDLPQTVAMLPPGGLPGVDVQVHNFFEEQPVKGARFYYLRNILHDWPDDKCVVILSQLKAALAEGSQILIDEMVLPNESVPWEASVIDLTMLASLGSRERTVAEWTSLLDAAGLEAKEIYTYSPRRKDSIIQVVPK